MIYHYTTQPLAESIRQDGVLKAKPQIIYLDLLASRPRTLDKVVWFTCAEELDGPVAIKAKLDGIEAFARIVCADEVAPQDLPEWAYERGYDPQMFRWMLQTAALAGSDWQDWRLVSRDIPAPEWLRVEYLKDGNWLVQE